MPPMLFEFLLCCKHTNEKKIDLLKKEGGGEHGKTELVIIDQVSIVDNTCT